MMLTGIEETETMLVGILLNAIAKAIVDVVHELAVLYGQYLVESTGSVETNSTRLLKLLAGLDFFFRQPNLVGKAELQFIAVAPGLLRTKNRAALRQRYLTDALQIVHHLLLLVAQLLLVRQNLPLAAAAHTIMRAEGLCSTLTLLVDMGTDSFGIVMFLARNTKVNHIARHYERNENNQVVYADKGFSFGCHILYLYFTINRQFFLFSRHILALFFYFRMQN